MLSSTSGGRLRKEGPEFEGEGSLACGGWSFKAACCFEKAAAKVRET